MTNAPFSNSALSGANLRGAVDLSSLVLVVTIVAASWHDVIMDGLLDGARRALTESNATFTEVLDLSATVPVIVEFYGRHSVFFRKISSKFLKQQIYICFPLSQRGHVDRNSIETII